MDYDPAKRIIEELEATEQKTEPFLVALQRLVRPGKKVRISYGPQGLPPKVHNIRSIVDKDQVVSRVWANGRWNYEINNMHWFSIHLRDGQLERA